MSEPIRYAPAIREARTSDTPLSPALASPKRGARMSDLIRSPAPGCAVQPDRTIGRIP
ncbi:MAG TPA: hypothetical protein VHL98_06450 [Microvirga sp.]|jgi:hypothetical protein|nr:hypothetical protein [Microvirga sp.]